MELASIPATSIRVDAQRFQFKLYASRAGTTPVLQDAARWNPDLAGVLTVWRDLSDPEPGPFVINGHHRLALALRCVVELVAVRFLSAATAIEARTIGALQNIAEERGTAIDAAKLFRDAAMGPAELAAYGVPRDGRTARTALELAHLPPDLFGAAATGRLPLEVAAAIGSSQAPPTIQRKLAQLALRNDWTAAKASEAAEIARLAHLRPFTQNCLPGCEDLLESSNLEPLLEIRAAIRARLRSEIRDLSAAALPKRASVLAAAGNVIDAEGSRQARAQVQTTAAYFGEMVNHPGPLADLVGLLAGEITPKRPASVIVGENLELLRESIAALIG